MWTLELFAFLFKAPHFARMSSLLQSLSTHYSKPDVLQRVKFVNGVADTTQQSAAVSMHDVADRPTNTVVSENWHETSVPRDQVQCDEGIGDRHTRSKQATEEDKKISVGVDEGGVEGASGEGEQMRKTGLTARLSFLRPAIAGLCSQCIVAVVGRGSVEHCSLLCVALRLYGEAETVLKINKDNRIRALLGEGAGTGSESEVWGEAGDEGMEEGGGGGRGGKPSRDGESGENGEVRERRDGDKARVKDGVQVTQREGDEGEATYTGVTKVVVCLSNCLLKAIDGSLIRGSDPQSVEGVVGSILLLLQIEGVSIPAVTNLLHQMVQVRDKLHLHIHA